MKAAVVVALLVLSACAPREPLPTYGSVPQFTLVAEDGETYSSEALTGKVWVADFIFTTCQGPCPRMSSQMRRIQQAFRDTEDVRLVSFTVDPKTDTPKVLQAYARRYTADAGVWTFLTGELEQLHDLSRNVFKLADVSGDLNHSTRFVLVDRRSRIRGYYATWEEGTIDKLIADIQFLLQEPA